MVPGVPGVPGSRRRGASALFLALLVLSSCHRGASESDLRRMYDQANLAFLHGELTEAQAIAERGLAQAGPQADSEWSWRFRLLRGDILISGRNLSEVRALVHAALPPASSESLRAKQAFLEARVLLADRRFDAALSLAKHVAEIAPRDQQLRFDAEPLAGQILFQTGRWDEGEALLTGTVRAASEARDRYHEAFALHQLGMGQLVRNRFDQALALFERVLAFSDLSATSIYAKALNNAGIVIRDWASSNGRSSCSGARSISNRGGLAAPTTNRRWGSSATPTCCRKTWPAECRTCSAPSRSHAMPASPRTPRCGPAIWPRRISRAATGTRPSATTRTRSVSGRRRGAAKRSTPRSTALNRIRPRADRRRVATVRAGAR